MERKDKWFERAVKVLPGGVNSPVRAFQAVGGNPRFMDRAKGCRIWDVEGREYIDYVESWGPMILGHGRPEVVEAVKRAVDKGMSFGAATAVEVEVAELMVDMVGPLEMVRMVNSGTEAVMSALRLARGYTGREKVIKFAGCYHGHSDSMLVRAGSGAMTGGNPDSAGVTRGAAKDTLLAEYNDLESVRALFAGHVGEVAALIVEPVGANMGVVPPEGGFLEGLRKLCDENEALLIFDEVITGFRLAPGGAMAYYGVEADLAAYGKIIGGGMPVGAYGGKREIMEMVAPVGKVYQAGTLSGNPVAMAAGLATLTVLKEHPEIYQKIDRMAARLEEALKENLPCQVNRVGSLLCPFFVKDKVRDYRTAKDSDTEAFGRYFRHMLNEGIYLAPSQFEAMFVSNAHEEEDIQRTVEAVMAFQG